MGNRKMWAIVLGSAAGVALVSLAATWYMRTQQQSEPLEKDAQSMISAAYDKIKDLEQSLASWRSAEGV